MFGVCVALSIATLTAINSFRRDVHGSLIDEARALQGGDIILHAHQPFSPELQEAIDTLAGEKQISRQDTYEFNTVARVDGTETAGRSLLSNIKGVEPGYPFYGTVSLASGQALDEVLKPGSVIVAREVLDRLDVDVGEQVKIGEIAFEIADIVEFESMRPVSFLTFGPRIFMTLADVNQLGLTGRGSRAEYEILLKATDPTAAADLVEILKESAIPRLERVETATDARSRVKVFFDNLLFFISCIGILTLLLCGIGMQGALSAILRQKQRTIAVTKAVGATNRFIVRQYLTMVLLLGAGGSLLGVILGYGIKQLFPLVFRDLVPEGIGYSLHIADTLEGVILGILVVAVFTLLPLYRLGDVKPVMIFRHETGHLSNKTVTLLAGFICTGFLLLLVLRQINDIQTSVYFVLGLLALIGSVALVTSGGLWLLKRASLPTLALRQAAKSLYRPGNSTRSIVITLTSAISVLMVIYLLKLNLFASFIESYPENAPNLFCIDIQKGQEELFESVVGEEVALFPVIRARLLSINSVLIDQEVERKRKSDNLGREFNLTYRQSLLDDEIIASGDSLFGSASLPPGIVPVSVLDYIAEIGDIALNDRLRFNIQGVEIDALVTSIRARTKSRLYPFFYFVFEPTTLEQAPQTFFAALHLRRDLIPDMMTAIVSKLPNVSTVNVAQMADKFGRLMQRLSVIVTFFASFSIMAGCLILVSSIFATRLDRIRETVYYKVLGADSGFVLRVLAFEHIMLAVMSAIMAAGFAELSAWLICSNVFEIAYRPYWTVALLTILLSVVLVVAVGIISSMGIIGQKPATFLQQQNGV